MYVRPFTLFSTVHPALLIFLCAGAPILAMFGSNPVTMGVMFCVRSRCIGFILAERPRRMEERDFICSDFCFCVKYAVKLMGVTELFKIGSRLFTLESMCYGLMNGLMLER